MKRWLEALDEKDQQPRLREVIIDPGPSVLKHLKKAEAGGASAGKKARGNSSLPQ